METVTVQTEAYQLLIQKINEMYQTISEIKSQQSKKVQWVNNDDAGKLLDVSRRTLQTYRTNGVLPFSQFSGKIYYKISDLNAHLERYYVGAFTSKKIKHHARNDI